MDIPTAFLNELEKIAKRGLWDNIHAKRRRIAAGSGERMRRPGSEGAPTAKALRESKEKKAAEGDLVRVHAMDGDKALQHFFVRVKKWAPPSGRVEAGESRRAGAARELLERTGYEVKPRRLRYRGEDERGFHNFSVDAKHLRQVAKPGERGGYSTKIKWASSKITKEDIHRKAESLGIIWDYDKKGSAPFLQHSLRVTGKTHVDDMTPKEIEALYDSLDAFEKKAEIEYRGITFPGYNKPIASNRKGKKKMVLVKRGDRVKLVHFGQKGYEDFTQHKDPKRRENYLKRSGGIRGKGGKLTANDPFSANYWARKELW